MLASFEPKGLRSETSVNVKRQYSPSVPLTGQILRETWARLSQTGPGFLLGFDLGYFEVSNEGSRATKGSRDALKGKI